MRKLEITLTAEQRLQLRCLFTSPAMGEGTTLLDVVQYIIASVCDGIRRPGSWERGVVAQMFGEWDYLPPPLCSICKWNVLDEDDPLEMDSQHCETCLVEAIDLWSVEQSEDDESLSAVVWVALGMAEPGGEVPSPEDQEAARALCWEAMGGQTPLVCEVSVEELADEEVLEIASMISASLAR